jgi:hypothetical protein
MHRCLIRSLLSGIIMLMLGVPAALATPLSHNLQTPAASEGLLFVENVGQFDARARFQVRGDTNLFLADDALWLTVFEPDKAGEAANEPLPRTRTAAPSSRRGVNLKLSFTGANAHPHLEPFGRLDTHMCRTL